MMNHSYFGNVSLSRDLVNTHAYVLHLCNNLSRSEHFRRERAANGLAIGIGIVHRGATVRPVHQIIAYCTHSCKIQ